LLIQEGRPAEPEPVSVDEPENLSPCEILGVGADASIAKIKVAYRNRVKQCHPDRFAGMDEDSRMLAEEWTKALNAAYESLVIRKRNETISER
jgi:curved DNA-binding protein CbpA